MTRLYSIHVSTGRLSTSGYLVSREGGVSAIGANGVNAHVIEEPITSIRRKAANA